MELDTINAADLWVAAPDGKYDVCPLVAAHAKIMNRGAGYLVAYVRSPEHLKAVQIGRDKLATIQLHLTSAQLRREAERLLRAADELDGVNAPRN